MGWSLRERRDNRNLPDFVERFGERHGEFPRWPDDQ
jgi:hypothetical protein